MKTNDTLATKIIVDRADKTLAAAKQALAEAQVILAECRKPATTKTVRRRPLTEDAVARYAKQYGEMLGALANLTEFVETLPAPDEDGDIPGLDYADLGSLNELHTQITVACETADELSEIWTS